MFSWKNALAEKATPRGIVDNFDLIVDMAEDDVKFILRKTNFDFIANSENFADIYRTVCSDISERKLKKWKMAIEKNEKKGIALCLNSAETIQWIISRIANEIKNLFDTRYRLHLVTSSCVRGNVEVVDYTCEYNELRLLKKEEIIKGIIKVWRDTFDLEVVEHLFLRFEIEKKEIFQNEAEIYLKLSNNNERQLAFDFDRMGVA